MALSTDYLHVFLRTCNSVSCFISGSSVTGPDAKYRLEASFLGRASSVSDVNCMCSSCEGSYIAPGRYTRIPTYILPTFCLAFMGTLCETFRREKEKEKKKRKKKYAYSHAQVKLPVLSSLLFLIFVFVFLLLYTDIIPFDIFHVHDGQISS